MLEDAVLRARMKSGYCCSTWPMSEGTGTISPARRSYARSACTLTPRGSSTAFQAGALGIASGIWGEICIPLAITSRPPPRARKPR